MSREISAVFKQAISCKLPVFLAILVMAIIFSMGLVGQITAEAAETKEDPWSELPSKPPADKVQKIILSKDNEFVISIWRAPDGSWEDIDNGIKILASNNPDKNKLIAALDKAVEFKMELPDAVLEQMKNGHKVGVAATGTWALTRDELFRLDKMPLQYRLEDNYLYIKGYPQVNFLANAFYDDVINNFPASIPFIHPRYGTNVFSMHDLNTGKELGSASGYIKSLYPSSNALNEELAHCASNNYIHISQIVDANGYLRNNTTTTPKKYGVGYDTISTPFDVSVWKDNKETVYKSDKIRIGNGGFKDGSATGLRFWYPLALTFYVEKDEDVAVDSITYTELIDSSPATATVTVANYGVSPQEPWLKFLIPGIIDPPKLQKVTLAPGEKKQFIFNFTSPQTGFVEMTAEINPVQSNGKREFEEITYDNNALTVVGAVGMLKYEDLPHWVLSKKLYFTTQPTIADLKLDPGCWWAGNAIGTLTVDNCTPEVYRDFKVNGIRGDSIDIHINQPSAHIVIIPRINATLKRPDFGDDPQDRDWADNDYDPLSLTGSISGDGEVKRRYGYIWYCGGCRGKDHDYCPGHVGYDYKYASFEPPIDYQKEYKANVYNGIEELPYHRPLNKPASDSLKIFDKDAMNIFIEKYKRRQLPGGERGFENVEEKFDLYWEGTHYDFEVVRWMCHRDESNDESGWESAPGQYKRTFVGQSKGYVKWETVETMTKFYDHDRKAATLRKSGSGEYDYAVFATDKQLQKYDWPIKSGYYFHPGGTYKCTVYTAQYKNSQDKTKEHEELVRKVRAAFYYDSDLVYVDNKQVARKLGDINEAADRGLLKIDPPTYSRSGTKIIPDPPTKLITTKNRQEVTPTIKVNDWYKEVMEGYDESHTLYKYDMYKYMERTDNTVSVPLPPLPDIWLVEETTVINFKMQPPQDGRKLYTHVDMKNGDYAVLVKVKAIEVDFDDVDNQHGLRSETQADNGVLEMKGFNLDGIKVTVSGSMYDDR